MRLLAGLRASETAVVKSEIEAAGRLRHLERRLVTYEIRLTQFEIVRALTQVSGAKAEWIQQGLTTQISR